MTTDYHRTGLFFGSPGPNCVIKRSLSANETFNAVAAHFYTEENADDHFWYDATGVGGVVPVMTVFMPNADAKRINTVYRAKATVGCLQITDYNPGSRVSERIPGFKFPSLPSTNGGRSRGSIAGIAVGTVCGVGLLAVALVLWRRRSRVKEMIAAVSRDAAPQEMVSAELGSGSSCQELYPAEHRIPELPNTAGMGPVELDAHTLPDQEVERSISVDNTYGGSKLRRNS